MVGLALALVGGAARGWGEGQLANIKATREEKLRQLELERAERMETRRQTFESSENKLTREASAKQAAAQLAATEKLTMAEIGSQEKRTTQQLETQKDISGAEIGARKELTFAELASREKTAREQIASQEKTTTQTLGAQKEISEAEIGSQEKRSTEQTAAQERIAKAQVDAAAELGIKPVQTKDGKIVLMRGSEVLATPVDPNTGKPIDIAVTADDTPEMSNYKFLISSGVAEDQARQLAFSSKSADPALLKTSLVETLIKAQTTYKTADEDTVTNAEKWADTILKNMGVTIPGAEAGAGAPASATEAAAAPTERPAGSTDEDIIADAKRVIAQEGATPEIKAAIKIRLRAWGIDPAAAGL